MLNWIVWVACVLLSSVVMAEETRFSEYIDQLKKEAVTSGISVATADAAFANIKLFKRAIAADQAQPEIVSTLDDYLPRAVPQWKVDKGVRLYQEHRTLLEKIGQEYGVQPRFIVALWGIETNYGNYTGNYSVIGATASLAYEGRREAFFKEQLFAALRIVEEGHISLEDLKGSWAGAMGQTQFMPTSFLHYAVDYDGDGRKDIWHSLPDIFASAANYLQSIGWDENKTWARQVRITGEAIDESETGLLVKKTLPQWQALGVRRWDGADLPSAEIRASLIYPDTASGRIYLAYSNYDALMQWNRSHYFVIAVGHLSEKIRAQL